MLRILATGLDAAGSAIVIVAVVQALTAHLMSLGRPITIAPQQRLLASGLVFALTFKSAAGILRTTTVHTWEQLGMVVAIIALRFLLGQVLRNSATGVGG